MFNGLMINSIVATVFINSMRFKDSLPVSNRYNIIVVTGYRGSRNGPKTDMLNGRLFTYLRSFIL